MNIIIEGNPFLRKLAINLLTSYQLNKKQVQIKYQKSISDIPKSKLINEIKNLSDKPNITLQYLITKESNQKIELNKNSLSILEELNDNFYTIYYEIVEPNSIYYINDSLLSINNEDQYKVIKRTNKNLTSTEYKKYFCSLYDLLSNKEIENKNTIQKENNPDINHFILDKSPFSLYVDDLNYEKHSEKELQDYIEIESLLDESTSEKKIIIKSEKRDSDVIAESDIIEKEIITNYALSKEWFNDLLYLESNKDGIKQIDYQKSNISLSDLQEITNSIIDNNIIFINLTNISDSGYNRYSSIKYLPFTDDEFKRLEKLNKPNNVPSQASNNDMLYNSIGIKNFFKCKKSSRRKKTEENDIKDDSNNKYNSDGIYKNYYEINIPFSLKKDNSDKTNKNSKVIKIEEIQESLYKELKDIINSFQD